MTLHMRQLQYALRFFLIFAFLSPFTGARGQTLSDDSLFNLVQYRTFQYFWEGAEPNSGMAPERIHVDGIYPEDDAHIVTVGGSGFGVMVLLVGMERGYISREEGLTRLEKIIAFLEKADRYHGAWPHWLDGRTAKTKPFSPEDDGGDLVETAFMVQGLLTVREYMDEKVDREKNLAQRIDKLWRAVEWDWYTQGQNVLYWHWSPNHAWAMNFPVRGYNEALIMYVLAASSPTHPIAAEVYHEGWAREGNIRADIEQYGYELPLRHNGAVQYGGPLFWSHYSFLGLDPRNLKSPYADYWKHNTNHVLIDWKYCIENPFDFPGYSADCWGLTASYSPRGYAAHHPGRGTDRGVITPTASLSSFPYTPEQSTMAMRYFYDRLGPYLWGPYGFYDAFSERVGYYPPRYLAIDQGPIVIMMENHRSGLLWELFMSAPEIQKGLKKLDFTFRKPEG